MPQLDLSTFPSQIFWLAAFFVVLYLLMAKIAIPGIEKVIDERRNRIDGDLDKAGQMKAEAEAVIAAYEKGLADARHQAQLTMKETSDQLAALADLRGVAVEVARSAAAKLVGAAVDEARAGAAVDAVLKGRAS